MNIASYLIYPYPDPPLGRFIFICYCEKMAGNDKLRVVGLDQDQLEEFVCGICQDVLNDPVFTNCCRQSYCRQCIVEWLRNHSTYPNDRSAITRNDLGEVPRFIGNLINKMKIKCKLYDKGCEVVVNIEK